MAQIAYGAVTVNSNLTAYSLSCSNASMSNISFKGSNIDYASGSNNGFLRSNDYVTFNGKQDVLPAASASADGFLTSNNWAAFNGKQDVLPAASASADGFLTSNNWAAFNGKLSSVPIATASLAGLVKPGANLSVTADGTLNASALNYTLPVASTSVLGGVRQGNNVSIDASGIISANAAPYVLQPAGGSILGGVKIGANITALSDGTISTALYTLPAATASNLGGIRVGSGLSVANGTISVNSVAGYTLSIATENSLGGIKIGAGLSTTLDGTLSANVVYPYQLPVATSTVLGGFRVGSGLSISSGVLSTLPISPATTSNLGLVKIGTGLTVDANGLLAAVPDYITSVQTFYGLSVSATSILGITASSSSTNGALTAADWTAFNNKQSVISVTMPLVKTGNQLSIGYATASTDGYLTAATHNVLMAKQDSIAVASPLVKTGNALSMNIASTSADGYLSAANFTTFNNKLTVESLPDASTNTRGVIKVGNNLSVDANGFLNSVGTVGGTGPPGPASAYDTNERVLVGGFHIGANNNANVFIVNLLSLGMWTLSVKSSILNNSGMYMLLIEDKQIVNGSLTPQNVSTYFLMGAYQAGSTYMSTPNYSLTLDGSQVFIMNTNNYLGESDIYVQAFKMCQTHPITSSIPSSAM